MANLWLERAHDKNKIAALDTRLKGVQKILLEQLAKNMEKLQAYGVDIKFSILQNNFRLLDNFFLKDLLERKVSAGEILKILELKDENLRTQKLKQWEKKILLEGIAKYFAAVSQIFATVLKHIEGKRKRQTDDWARKSLKYLSKIKTHEEILQKQKNTLKTVEQTLTDIESLEKLFCPPPIENLLQIYGE